MLGRNPNLANLTEIMVDTKLGQGEEEDKVKENLRTIHEIQMIYRRKGGKNQ